MSTRSKKTPRSEPFSFTKRLKEIDMFFQGKGPVHQTMRRTVRRLERAGIPYAVCGGMAVNAHRYQRTTGDVDILVTLEGFTQFRQRFVRKNYEPVDSRPLRFVDRANDVTVDFLITGHFPGSGDPGPIAYPDPVAAGEVVDRICFLDLATLIELKLAARRHKDFGDVVELIGFNNLDESFVEQLHESVHDDYIECLEEKRREDRYEARRTPTLPPDMGPYK